MTPRLPHPASLIVALLAPLLLAGQPHARAGIAAAAGPAAPAACGIAPWTGTCACATDQGVLPYDRYAELLRGQSDADLQSRLYAERQRCRLPDAAPHATPAPPPAGQPATPLIVPPHPPRI